MYRIVLSPEAARFFEAADAGLQRRLDRCFEALRATPRRHAIKVLRGRLAGRWRYRVGNWRVIYSIDDAAQAVNVIQIAERRNAYE